MRGRRQVLFHSRRVLGLGRVLWGHLGGVGCVSFVLYCIALYGMVIFLSFLEEHFDGDGGVVGSFGGR